MTIKTLFILNLRFLSSCFAALGEKLELPTLERWQENAETFEIVEQRLDTNKKEKLP